MPIQRATLRSFNPATWRANVELVGAPTALLEGLPVAASLGPDLLAPGTRVWVYLSEEGNPADGAVVVPYGAPPAPWVTSRLWRPALATAQLAGAVPCTSTAYVSVAGLQVSLDLEATSTALLLLAATGSLATGGITYTLAFFHDDAHETTEVLPAEAVGGSGATGNETWALTWLALQTGVAPGAHTFVLKHRVSSGQAVLEQARVVGIAMGE